MKQCPVRGSSETPCTWGKFKFVLTRAFTMFFHIHLLLNIGGFLGMKNQYRLKGDTASACRKQKLLPVCQHGPALLLCSHRAREEKPAAKEPAASAAF